jgi:hypothetical protein
MSTTFLDADFKTKPFLHQLREFEENAEADARAMAWTMRTGKSKATIDRACRMYQLGQIDAVLIVAPNGVHANWVEREFPIHAWDSVPVVPLVWRSAVVSKKAGKKLGRDKALDWGIERELWLQRLKTLQKTPALAVLAIATETMTRKDVRAVVARFFKSRKVFAVIDESDDFGTPGSLRTKMARAFARRAAKRLILSGTMLTGSPLAAFSQFEILEKGALGFGTYQEFKDHFAVYETQHARGRSFQKIVGYKNLDDLRDRIAKYSSVVLRSETDMPDLEFDSVQFEPTEEQIDIYKGLRESFLIDLDEGTISVGERAPRFQKMQQVFSGFVNDEYRSRVLIPGLNPRLDATAHQCFLAPGKFIVWCEFQADIDFVTKRLREDGMKIVEYHGRVSDKQKKANLVAFNTDSSIDGFVGHVQAGGRGLDISVASTIINHSHTFKARMREQSLERASKIGGGNIRVVDIFCNGPDQYILKTTASRTRVADSVVGSGLRQILMGV